MNNSYLSVDMADGGSGGVEGAKQIVPHLMSSLTWSYSPTALYLALYSITDQLSIVMEKAIGKWNLMLSPAS